MKSFSAPSLNLGWSWSLVEGSFIQEIPIVVVFVISDGSYVDLDGFMVLIVLFFKLSISAIFLLFFLLFLS